MKTEENKSSIDSLGLSTLINDMTSSYLLTEAEVITYNLYLAVILTRPQASHLGCKQSSRVHSLQPDLLIAHTRLPPNTNLTDLISRPDPELSRILIRIVSCKVAAPV